MGSRVLAIELGLACVAIAGAAWADDFFLPAVTPQPLPTLSFIQEVRVGAYAHNWIHNEDAPVDLSVEALSSPLSFPGYANPWVSGNPWVDWFFVPRMNLGAMINVEGKTSYAFGGFTWRIPVYGPVYFEGELGGAVNNAVRTPTPNRVDMGCVATFRESGGFGVQLTQNVDLILNIEHISHLTFCSKTNPGITDVGFRVGYKF